MTILEARLNQMRQAAVRLRESGHRVDESVRTVHQLVDELLSMGVESPASLEFVARYRNQKNVMDDWGSVISLFARHLDTAADEVELAIIDPGRQSATPETGTLPPGESLPLLTASGATYSGTLSMGGRYWRQKSPHRAVETIKRDLTPPVEVAAPDTIPYDGYLSRENRPLYQNYLQKKSEFEIQQAHIESLEQQHQQKVEDLLALKNRLMSVDHQRDIDAIPRVQAIKAEITGAEQDIFSAKEQLRKIELETLRLSDRLDRVTPAPGADLMLIASMEKGETLQIIKDNTQDCVKYIVNRMAIPPGLPTDAHLWNENIARMPEYGISMGHEPLEGAVLVMEREHSYAHDIYGHLMYVEKVENGQVWVTDNTHAEPVLLSDVTQETKGANVTYLYFPWETKG